MSWKNYILTGLFLSFGELYAQDIHFSQFFSSPMNANPSQTGLFDGSHRVVFNHRNQWSAVSIPYMTFSGSFDANYRISKLSGDRIGAGIHINSDKAGDSEFSTNQAYLSLSYIKSFNRRQTNLLSFGLQTGVSQTSINYSKLSFDNQYNGTIYDPSILTDENLNNSNFIYADVAAGINWLFKPGMYEFYSAGLSVFHINQPSLGFYSEPDNRVERKIVGHVSSSFKLNAHSFILPGMVMSKQGASSEFLLGANVRFRMVPDAGNLTNIYLGAWYRNKDAPYIVLGADFFNLYVGLSYDINTSQLKPASHNRGGYEVALIYTWQKFKKHTKNKNACPSFI